MRGAKRVRDARQTQDLPAASQLARLLVCSPEKVEAGQPPLLAHILQHSVAAAAYKLAQNFTRLVRECQAAELLDGVTPLFDQLRALQCDFGLGVESKRASDLLLG